MQPTEPQYQPQPQPSPYVVTSTAKIKNKLFATDSILAADNQNVYVFDLQGSTPRITIPLVEIRKANAQLGELYIKHAKGKTLVVKFTRITANTVTTNALSSAAGSLYMAKQASDMQPEMQKWIDFFASKNINSKQQLSPKKFAIGVSVAAIIIGIIQMMSAFSKLNP
jgi:hypothetical protein